MKNALRKKVLRILSSGIVVFVLAIIIFFMIPPQKGSLYPEFSSFIITDRNGTLLREVLSKDYKTSVWKPLREISPDMIKATIIREDKRFFLHKGIDFIALFRALYENISSGKVRSGGSTITMQVAKILLNYQNLNILKKFIQIIYALKLELYLNKEQILEIYLNRAPYGNQTYGVEAAARFYFNKPAKDLSLSESCLLAQIPKAPSLLHPIKNFLLTEKNKIDLLEKILKYGLIDTFSYLCAKNEQSIVNRKKILFRAPHFVDFILSQNITKTYSTITSTIDYNLQEKLEKILFTSINALKKYNVNQGSIVVIDTKTGEIMAMVGSKDYFEENEGQVNGCVSLRQPGSSLKPFLYILALQNGFPMSYLMNDTVTEFKLPDGTVFAPRNYGNKYHRLVRAREALGSSFNVPAVILLDKIGVENFYTFLTRLHFTTLFKNPNFYGYSLSLGAAEVKLIELVNAYRAIANKGMWTQYKFIKNEKSERIGERVFSEEAAYIITNVLSDNSSRIKAFGDDSPLNLPFPCAVKTGTTKNFKDNWCIGFTGRYTVGVWVGNFDGAPMNGVSGISGAGPLFRDIMIELHRDGYPEDFEEPKTLVHFKICAQSGLIAGKHCPAIDEIFIPGTEPKDTCYYCVGTGFIPVRSNGNDVGTGLVPVRNNSNDVGTGLVPVRNNGQPQGLSLQNKIPNVGTGFIPVRNLCILHPQNGDIFKLDPHIPYKNQAIAFKIEIDSGIESFALYLNGKKLCENQTTYLWQPKPGRYELEARANDKSKSYIEKIYFTVY